LPQREDGLGVRRASGVQIDVARIPALGDLADRLERSLITRGVLAGCLLRMMFMRAHQLDLVPLLRCFECTHHVASPRIASMCRSSDIARHVNTPPNRILTGCSQRSNRLRGYDWEVLHTDRHARSEDGSHKLLLRTEDGRPLEAVLMQFERGGGGAASRVELPPRYTACLSSQSGCALSCTFCATGRMRLGRSLTRDEIVEQFRALSAINTAPIDNVVMMGMGEPFHNYDEVLAALRELADPRGFAVAPRRMTISTVGWVPGIERFAEDDFPARLALSLHAANDRVRGELMPVNKRFPIDRLLTACAAYCERTRKKLFVEYLMLAGINDADADAAELASLMDAYLPGRCHVNLIAYNPAGTDLVGSAPERVRQFRDRLREREIPSSYRVSRASDIAGACGQLAATTG
jgi:23S rRNA (adenine2503-C2)-methyltransferase